jgi:hypothetical protein
MAIFRLLWFKCALFSAEYFKYSIQIGTRSKPAMVGRVATQKFKIVLRVVPIFGLPESISDSVKQSMGAHRAIADQQNSADPAGF